MKALIISFFILSLVACEKRTSTTKNLEHNSAEPELDVDHNIDAYQYVSRQNLEFHQEKTKSIKRERLITAKDDKVKLQELVITKKFYKEEDMYILDYKYPYLNEELDTKYADFNDFMVENYLNIEATENEILEGKVLFCDSLAIGRCMDTRIIDYKTYNVNSDFVSFLLYKENYYSGMKHSTYMFECLNYDLNKYTFIYYNDFFIKKSEKELFTIINNTILDGIRSGELYYDCWELSEKDFRIYKNNFVIHDNIIEFCFDDCIICPSYTGTYSIEIPVNSIIHLIKKYNHKPLVG